MIRPKRIASFCAVLLLLCLPLVIWWQRWSVYDYFRLRNYQPSQAVVQIANDTTMTDLARHLLFVYHPELDDKPTFNANCKNGEHTIVLGCYVPSTGIYVYKVTEPRLEGILQVTTAHETLHAAYGRLQGAEKQHINDLINQAYAQVSDPRIQATVADYQKNGADVTNELHSILGTEVRKLPPELEQYYTRYFQHRSVVVDYSERYEQAFDERKQQVTDDDKQLQVLKQQVDDSQNRLSQQKTSIDSHRSDLDTLLAAKNYEAYNSGVPSFNAQVAAYNAQVAQVKSLIDQYNSLVIARNAIAVEEGQLVNAIDSRPTSLPVK